ncbi:hypothetical protein ALC62_12865 [Cyphomyrmex costatus]|uniref:Uncharacterized protein n=1 Tax=Cyphomyrmex costatus TaxID=456900 RepID=A0A195C8Q5_9HYME|nr:hypothetical protein ALC62_12865 [Cyphomyrmex costatus]
MKDTPRRVDVYRIAIQYDQRGTARRDAPMQAFAELLAVIIRAAIVVVINQSLTLPDSRIAIHAEYLACVNKIRSTRAGVGEKASKGEIIPLSITLNTPLAHKMCYRFVQIQSDFMD